MEHHAIRFAKQFAEEVRVEMARQHRTARDLAVVLSVTPATAGTRINGDVPFTASEMMSASHWLGLTLSAMTARAEQALEQQSGRELAVAS